MIKIHIFDGSYQVPVILAISGHTFACIYMMSLGNLGLWMPFQPLHPEPRLILSP